MTTQINLKFQDEFYQLTKNYAGAKGYISVQELLRDALREKIFSDLELREEYKEVLKSKEANTFMNSKESKAFHDELRKKAGLK